MFKFGKKGFANQFNWIFVLIAGTIFFSFFFLVIKNAISGEEADSAQTLTNELDALIKVSMASTNTEKIVPFDKKMFFSCEDEVSEYYVGKRSYKAGRYDFEVVFSPDELEARDLLFKTSIFEVPFKIMPFVFLINDDIEFVIVDSDESKHFSSQVKELFPVDTRIVEVKSLSSYEDKAYDRVVFIVNSEDASLLSSLKIGRDKDKSDAEERFFAVKVDPKEGVLNSYGGVSFMNYEKGKFVEKDKESSYFGNDLLLGALVSHNKKLYDCQVIKVMNRLELLAVLHKKRITDNYLVANLDPVCASYYSTALSFLDNMELFSSQFSSNPEVIPELFNSVQRLKSLNMELVRKVGECPALY